MFETLLESGRRRAAPTPHAAMAFTLHASALIGAIGLTRAASLPLPPVVPRARAIIYIPVVASQRAIGASEREYGASLPVAPVMPEWTATTGLSTTLIVLDAMNIGGPPTSRLELDALIGRNGGGQIGGQRVLADADRPPELLVSVPPVYPAMLLAAGVTGRVVLEFVVDSSGRYLESTLRIVSTDHPAFVEPARTALQQSRFRAARAQGLPTSAWVRQSVRFSLDPGGH